MEPQLPLFPLTTALVPGLVLPLHIFEPRYRLMVEELLAKPEDEREFGIVAVRERHVAAGGAEQSAPSNADEFFPVGVTAVLRQADRLDDGRYDIVAVGGRRFRVGDVDRSAPLLRAEVDFWEEPEVDPDDPATRGIVDRAKRSFERYRGALGGRLDEQRAEDEQIPDDPTVLSYLITAALIVDAGTRQELLVAPDALTRLVTGIGVLDTEAALIAALGAVPALDLLNSAPSAN
jgi:Lon protease-like protein